MSVASCDEVAFVVDAKGVVAKGLWVLGDVADVAQNGGYGGRWPEVAAKGWNALSSGGVDVGGAFERHVKLVWIVESRVQTFGPGVCSTEVSCLGLWRTRADGVGTMRRDVLARFHRVVGDLVDEGARGVDGGRR